VLLALTTVNSPAEELRLKMSTVLARVPDLATAMPPRANSAPANDALAARDGQPPLGIGDQIAIAVFGQPDLSAEVTVGESGAIMVPLIGTFERTEPVCRAA
jgi:polysaccharide export outer membrane protein